jgi:hypothetical protein
MILFELCACGHSEAMVRFTTDNLNNFRHGALILLEIKAIEARKIKKRGSVAEK